MATTTHWTPNRIIAALRAEAKRRGRAPAAREWAKRTSARRTKGKGRPGYRRPNASTVIATFGSWNAALVAAGLETRPAHRPTAEQCARGHALRGDNLIVTRSGERRCRTCQRRWSREHKRRQRATPPKPPT